MEIRSFSRPSIPANSFQEAAYKRLRPDLSDLALGDSVFDRRKNAPGGFWLREKAVRLFCPVGWPTFIVRLECSSLNRNYAHSGGYFVPLGILGAPGAIGGYYYFALLDRQSFSGDLVYSPRHFASPGRPYLDDDSDR